MKKISIEIIKESDDLLSVNGKKVLRNMDGNWVQEEVDHLTAEEIKSCSEFIATLERCHRIQKATYTY